MSELSDDTALELIRNLQSGRYATEAEGDAAADRLDAQYLGILDLIFHDRRNLSAEEILEEAKKKSPIALGPSSGL